MRKGDYGRPGAGGLGKARHGDAAAISPRLPSQLPLSRRGPQNAAAVAAADAARGGELRATRGLVERERRRLRPALFVLRLRFVVCEEKNQRMDSKGLPGVRRSYSAGRA